MKFVLVNPGFLSGGMAAVFKTPPLGLLYVAGAITDAGDHEVKIIDTVVDKMSQKALKAEFSKADVVGVSSLTSSFVKSKDYLTLAKETGATTIMGGFQPTLMPEVACFQEIDAIVRGEGEVTISKIVKKMDAGTDWRHTKGVSYYDKELEQVVHMPDRPLLPDLDMLPFPRFDLVSHYKYTSLGFDAGLIETSRGCSFGCNFCCVAKVYGRSWRKKSIERVIEEHRRLPSNVKWVFNVDDNYVMNPRRAIELSHRIVKEGLNTKSMIIQARADALARHPEMMDWLAASGVRLVFIGVESISPRSLKLMNKGVKTIQYIKDAFDGLSQRGIAIWASIITGAEPTYTEAREALDMTIDFLHAHNVAIMQCTSLTAYPGTAFYDEAVQKGWVKPVDITHPERTNISPDRPDFPRSKMPELIARAFKRFYLSPKYFFKLAKWRQLLQRNWWWAIKVLGSFSRVGMDFIFGNILGDDLYEDENWDELAQLNPNLESLPGTAPMANPARAAASPGK
ncbi:MAG TPA: radical SAM protein [Candidatus Lokiarchaeia archaeon]|nr:radical SAM protein [Candidatus Lokiarchaeia archaeon]